MNRRIGIGIAAVVLGLSAGACSLTASQGADVAASSPPATASPIPATGNPTATETAEATPGPVLDVLAGERYAFRLQEQPSFVIVGTGPDGWTGYSWAMDGPDPVRADAPNGIGIAFLLADGVYSDPCHWDVLGTGLHEPAGDAAVGPTVDDLVARSQRLTGAARTGSLLPPFQVPRDRTRGRTRAPHPPPAPSRSQQELAAVPTQPG